MSNVAYIVAGAVVLLLIIAAVITMQQGTPQVQTPEPSVGQQPEEINVEELNQILEDINVDALDVNVTIDLPETI